MKPYEIWWADLPKPAGRRPVLLLTRTHAYSYLHKFVVAEITSMVRGIPIEVPLGSREGFTKPCVANCDNLRSVARSRLVQRLGTSQPNRQNEVKRAIGYAFAWEELIGVE